MDSSSNDSLSIFAALTEPSSTISTTNTMALSISSFLRLRINVLAGIHIRMLNLNHLLFRQSLYHMNDIGRYRTIRKWKNLIALIQLSLDYWPIREKIDNTKMPCVLQMSHRKRFLNPPSELASYAIEVAKEGCYPTCRSKEPPSLCFTLEPSQWLRARGARREVGGARCERDIVCQLRWPWEVPRRCCWTTTFQPNAVMLCRLQCHQKCSASLPPSETALPLVVMLTLPAIYLCCFKLGVSPIITTVFKTWGLMIIMSFILKKPRAKSLDIYILAYRNPCQYSIPSTRIPSNSSK